MTHDIDILIEHLVRVLPDIEVRQLKVTHPGVDDDGLWFFRSGTREVQVESTTHDLPFLIGTSSSHMTASSIEHAVATVRDALSTP